MIVIIETQKITKFILYMYHQTCGAANKGVEQIFSRKGFGYNIHPMCVCVCPILNVTMTRRCFSVLGVSDSEHLTFTYTRACSFFVGV